MTLAQHRTTTAPPNPEKCLNCDCLGPIAQHMGANEADDRCSIHEGRCIRCIAAYVNTRLETVAQGLRHLSITCTTSVAIDFPGRRIESNIRIKP